MRFSSASSFFPGLPVAHLRTHPKPECRPLGIGSGPRGIAKHLGGTNHGGGVAELSSLGVPSKRGGGVALDPFAVFVHASELNLRGGVAVTRRLGVHQDCLWQIGFAREHAVPQVIAAQLGPRAGALSISAAFSSHFSTLARSSGTPCGPMYSLASSVIACSWFWSAARVSHLFGLGDVGGAELPRCIHSSRARIAPCENPLSAEVRNHFSAALRSRGVPRPLPYMLETLNWAVRCPVLGSTQGPGKLPGLVQRPWNPMAQESGDMKFNFAVGANVVSASKPGERLRIIARYGIGLFVRVGEHNLRVVITGFPARAVERGNIRRREGLQLFGKLLRAHRATQHDHTNHGTDASHASTPQRRKLSHDRRTG